MTKRSDRLWIFVLGLGAGIVVWNFFGLLTPAPVYAQAQGESGPMGAGGIVAVTGLCAQSYSGLWIVDTRDSAESPTVCLYLPEGAGRSIRFAGARRIKWDLKLVAYKDTSERDMAPARLREQWEKMNDKANKESEGKNKD